jgi:aminopeptidase 2
MLSSHPIEVDVKSPSEVAQIFDAISYSKGASVIRMLNAYLSGEVFANGVRNYLKKHAYGNARTVDLWSALSDVSNQDIGKMMYSWTRDVGYPVISVVNEEYNEAKNELTLTISQERFLSSGQLKPEDDQVIWHIPISVVTHNISKPTVHLLTEKVGKITFNYESAIDNFYKLNANVTGFYRVRYSEKFLEKLGSAIEKQGQKFTITDKIGISADAFAIASAGLGSTAGALEIIKSYKNEENQMYISI